MSRGKKLSLLKAALRCEFIDKLCVYEASFCLRCLLEDKRRRGLSEIANAQNVDEDRLFDELAPQYDRDLLEFLCLCIILLQHSMSRGDVCLRLDAGGFCDIIEAFEERFNASTDLPEMENGARFCRISRALLKLYPDIEGTLLNFGPLIFYCDKGVPKEPAAGGDPLVEGQGAICSFKPFLGIEYGRLYFKRCYNYETRAGDFVLTNGLKIYDDEQIEQIKIALDLLFGELPQLQGLDLTDDKAFLQAAEEFAALNSGEDRLDLLRKFTGAKETALAARGPYKLMGSRALQGINLQKVAAAFAALKHLCIISGGPGTGKTTTVTKVLLLLCALSPRPLNIGLCAPTGKAAARLSQSVAAQLSDPKMIRMTKLLAILFERKDAGEILSQISVEAQTVHSLIKVIPHRVQAVYNEQNPLDLDVLVADEVSMLDLSLFNKLIAALPSRTQVIMLGDKDQLNSVEAGSVLGDICSRLGSAGDLTLLKLSSLTGYPFEALKGQMLSDEACLLTRSYRFNENSGIGVLSKIINARNFKALFGSVDLQKLPAGVLSRRLMEYTAYSDDGLNDAELYKKAKGGLCDAAFEDYKDIELVPLGKGSAGTDKDRQRELDAERKMQDDFFDGKPLSGLPLFDEVFYLRKEGTDRLFGKDRLDLESAAFDIAQFAVGRPEDGSANYYQFLEYLQTRNFTMDDNEAEQAFEHLDRFRVLCSNRHGLMGDISLNRAIEKKVKNRYRLKTTVLAGAEWFPGRVILVTKNDYALKIHNGDVGFAAYEKLPSGESGPLRVFLKNEAQNEIIKLSPLFIHNHESGYAMTIHKSQGSEYERVLVAVTEKLSLTLSQELIYTAITRAKKDLILICAKDILNEAVTRDAVRQSGLAMRLKGGRSDQLMADMPGEDQA